MAVTTYAIGAAVAVLAITFLVPLLTSPLNRIPGPIAAKFTDFWRLLTVWQGQAHEVHRDLHKQHGSVVRLGPNCVSIDDPNLIKVIYSSKTRWEKVSNVAVLEMLFHHFKSHITTKEGVGRLMELLT